MAYSNALCKFYFHARLTCIARFANAHQFGGMNLPDLIRSRREALGWSPARLGAEIGASRTQVENWEKGVHFPGVKFTAKLSQVLNIPLEAFSRSSSVKVSTTRAPKGSTSLVLVPWGDLGRVSGGKLSMASISKPRIIEAYSSVPPDSIALQMNDDSMEPAFQKGETFIVYLGKVELNEGDYVVARVAKPKEDHILRRYVIRRNGAYDLQAENPKHGTVSSGKGTEILGVVIEHHKRLRKI